MIKSESWHLLISHANVLVEASSQAFEYYTIGKMSSIMHTVLMIPIDKVNQYDATHITNVVFGINGVLTHPEFKKNLIGLMMPSNAQEVDTDVAIGKLITDNKLTEREFVIKTAIKAHFYPIWFSNYDTGGIEILSLFRKFNIQNIEIPVVFGKQINKI